MKKGVGPFTILAIAIFSLVITGTFFARVLIQQTATTKRTRMETAIIQGINKVELVKRSLPQALEYSFYQASYLVAQRGGYSSLRGVDSLECIPYWRVYGIENYPGLSGLGRVSTKIMNKYGYSLGNEVSIPSYKSVSIEPKTNDIIVAKAISDNKLLFQEDKINIQDKPTTRKQIKTNFVKMLKDARATFIDRDGIGEAVQKGVDLFLLNHPECNEIEIGDVCEDKMEDEANHDNVLERNCPNWETLLNDSIKAELNKLGLDGDSIKEIDEVYDGECSGEMDGEDSSCDCKHKHKVTCNDKSETDCLLYTRCRQCYDNTEFPPLYLECCSPSQRCNIPGCIGDDKGYFICDEHYKTVEDVKCTYDYYGSVWVLIGITDDLQYPIFDGTTDFRSPHLQFYVLSGNNYKQLNALENPSFEGGGEFDGVVQIPDGWEVTWTEPSPECNLKSNNDLPLEEQSGGSKALILDGNSCYKVFKYSGPFTVELKQTLTGLTPGSTVMLRVPVQVHLQRVKIPDNAIIKLSLNNDEKEVDGSDRSWVFGSVKTEVPNSGEVDITIHLESTCDESCGVDFFIDNLRLYSILHEGIEPITDNKCESEIFPPGTPIPFLPTVGKSKLGIQTSYLERGWDKFVEATQPTVVKLVDDFNGASTIRQISPETFIVARFNYDIWQPGIGEVGLSAEQAAEDWANFLIGRGVNLADPNIDCWEGFNEPVFADPEDAEWFSDFEIARMKILEERFNSKACIGSFSEGKPEIVEHLGDEWYDLHGMLEYASENHHYLSLHEYDCPGMDSSFDRNSGEGFHTGRYRKVYRKHIIPNGWNIPLIITETGIDCGNSGWRNHAEDVNDYLEQLKWYDSILKQDDYVIGATIFEYGLYGWDSFEIYPELTGNNGDDGPLVEYMLKTDVIPEQPTLIQRWPIDNHETHPITDCFGWRIHPIDKILNFHTGIDIDLPYGTELKAVTPGTIINVKNEDGTIPIKDGYGNSVGIEHEKDGQKYYTMYGHLKCNGILVSVGQTVQKGQVIGYSGGSDNCAGESTGNHLHFEIRSGTNDYTNSVNPCLYLTDPPCSTTCQRSLACERYDQQNDPTKCPR